MFHVSRQSVRASWPAYAGAFVALTFGIALIAVTATLIGAVETTGTRAGVSSAERLQLDDLSSMFGVMSGVSLFMAIFVVASTFGFVVATRQRELGLLRLIGATPRQVRRLLLGEAALVALAATVAGCLVGTALGPVALWALRAIGVTSVHLVAPPAWIAWVSAAPSGVLVALLGCRRASKRAAKVPPTAALREASLERRRPGVPAILTGALTAAAMVGTLVLAGQLSLLAAVMVAVFLPALMVAALTSLGPLVVPPVAALLARPFVERSVAARLAAGELRTAVRTTSSVAAPVTAIAAMAGSLLLTLSFTVDWSSGQDRAQFAAPVVVTDPSVAARLAADPAVGVVDVRRTVSLPVGDGDTEDVDVVDLATAAAARRLRADDGSLADLHGRTVAVAHTYLTDAGVHLGGKVTTRIDGKRVRLRIVAVVPDAPDLYGNLLVTPGLVTGAPTQLFLTPRSGVSDHRLLRAAQALAGGAAMTRDAWIDGVTADARRANNLGLLVVLGPAGLYAGIAIVNATLIGAAQRRRQLRLVGLLGATPDQVRRTALWQAGLTTGAGLLLGGTTAGYVGWLMRQAITRDLAGHPAAMTIPWLPLLGVAGTCVGLALVAALAAVGVRRRANAHSVA
ncbi:putative ABC transport system permease protein [Nocardioides terrae]|uniref:Putative ABC transport system permease protein n=1 Tax=Nocardioides terrae TaxID=574651 RepID=A0A1I1NU78_9ACTN|nr:FtsX-like permease family protein [Nocardioides terrae]SFD00976.1 putative ABC transport system permease protein [Nocardioides terrae]